MPDVRASREAKTCRRFSFLGGKSHESNATKDRCTETLRAGNQRDRWRRTPLFSGKEKGDEMSIGLPIHIGDSRDDQKALLIASGFKPTGFTAMDGRFEVIRQPKGVYGAAVTWTIWDYNWADEVSIYASDTLKAAKASLQFLAQRRLQDEMDIEMKCQAGWHCAAYPDGSDRWFSPEECRAAGWKTGRHEDGSIYWLMPNGRHANIDSYPDTPTQEKSPARLAHEAKLEVQQ